MSFKKWKKSIKKNYICEDNDTLKWWLRLHNIQIAPLSYKVPDTHRSTKPDIYNQKWVCKENKGKIYLNRYTLYLTVKGLKNIYIHKNILSLRTITGIIHDEYFKIFGNKCSIKATTTSILEYKYQLLTIRKYRTSVNVEAIWKRERASFKINRFIWSYLKGGNKYFNKPNESTYHNKIVNYFTQFKSTCNRQPRLVLIFGLPGSGKNWCLEKKRLSNHVSINVDDCRALLPRYWKMMMRSKVKKIQGDWINLFRAECKIIAEKIFNYALLHRMNIVWNGTGKNYQKYNRILHRAKKKNYIIELRYVWVPLQIAKSRVNRRASIIGRIVPLHIINLAEKNIPLTFKNLLNDADYARILENTCTSPTIVWDKDHNENLWI